MEKTPQPVGVEQGSPQYTEAEDLYNVASLFAVDVDSDQMQLLTGLDRKTISAIFDGSITISDRRNHTEVLGQFARTALELLRDLAGQESLDYRGLRRWLAEGQVRTSQGFKVPMDALSNPLLAREALAEVEVIRDGGIF